MSECNHIEMYYSLLVSVIKACHGTGCLNAHELRQALDKGQADVRQWKAAHDDLVMRNRELRDRPDLADRARSIKNLRAKMEKAQAELTQLQHVHAATEAELEQARKDRDTLAAEVHRLACKAAAQDWSIEAAWPQQIMIDARGALGRAT